MRIGLIFGMLLSVQAMLAQRGFVVADPSERGNFNAVRTNGFWHDWFLQAGLDMSLQNPYGYNFSHVFPNGKSFGMDVAVGKWFSPQVALRGKLNWENALPLLENEHANWLAPFHEPGVNRERGGYIGVYGDVLLNMHNLFGTYRPDRTWNLSLYPRIGVNYNFGVSKGSLLAGFGVLNTYRLGKRWSVYLDAAYIMSGSGFVGSESGASTGTGSNSNGYFSIGVGAQVELGKLGRSLRDDQGQDTGNRQMTQSSGVLTNGAWDNWFVQVGLDMSLMNPYGCNFSQVIPKGMTFGLNGALGKWFTPELGLRGRVQWENGLIPNNGVEWGAPKADPRENYRKGGIATVSVEAMLNLTNALAGYEPARRWHTSAFVRAGVITQFAEGSGSPLMGVGLEETCRLNGRLSLFGSLAYQVTTSEGMGVSTTGMNVSTGSNGFFDVDFGIRCDLGHNRFYRDREERQAALSTPACRHNWARFAVNTLASVGVAFGGKTLLKELVSAERPDHSDNKSFPSGHAAMAFAAARSVDKEFRRESVWIPVAGYAVATAVGVERVVSDRHHWYDAVAGAALGFGSAELTWWLSDKLLPSRNVAVGVSGNTVDVAITW